MRGVAAALMAVTMIAPAAQPDKLDIAGAWTLNRDLTTVPQPAEMGRRPGGRGGYGRPGGGGRGGFGGGLGRPGGTGGMGGGMGRPSDEEMRKMEVVRRRLTEIPERLIIVRDGASVSITDGNGRRMNYKTDGKKQDQLTGDGEFTTKAHFEGARFVLEEDFGGRKVTTTFNPILEGETPRLEVAVKADGGGRGLGEGRREGTSTPEGGATGDRANGAPGELKRIYNLEARGQQPYFF